MASATERLKQFGLNELSASRPKTLLNTVFTTVREPMFLLLLACSLIYITLGDTGEALLLSTAIVAVFIITIVQERRTEKTIEALKGLSSPRSLVIRDGIRQRIPGRNIVPGDLVLLEEGDRVPADGFVLKSVSLQIDESLLTGETQPVEKEEWDGSTPSTEDGVNASTYAYAGSLVIRGNGAIKIRSTGDKTAMGRIGASLRADVRPLSRLQIDTKRAVRVVAIISLVLSIGIILLYWTRNSDIRSGILMALTFAMSTIPEEFPVVLTIFMALGAWRISKQKVLTREMNAIEALGSATFLCVDKTGTLTENRMAVTAVWGPRSGLTSIDNASLVLRESEQIIINTCALASNLNGFDPMDQAAISVAKKTNPALYTGLLQKQDFPLVRPLLAVGYAWSVAHGDKDLLAAKGAPETIMHLCALEDDAQANIMNAIKNLATNGYRILGIARANLPKDSRLERLDTVRFEFIGLIGFCDPIRVGVPEAVAQCHTAGIKVLMMTGDYPATALSVARQIKLQSTEAILTGQQVASLQDEDLLEKLKETHVLARMLPEQKLRVVKLLHDSGEVIAMTGDGVNDAPALKTADIGIAMGMRGTDVAREAAALVLLEDEFTSIVGAIRLGRRVYDNIEKAVSYIIAIHVPIIGLTLLPLAIGAQAILLPLHLAFLEIIIDPVCSIVFEAETEEPSIMTRNPRSKATRLFATKSLFASISKGVMALIAVLTVYIVMGNTGEHPNHARAVAFSTLILVNFGLILTLRTHTSGFAQLFKHSNPALHWISGIIVCLAGAVLYIPSAAAIFHFESPHLNDIGASIGIASLVLLIFEIVKATKSAVK